MVTLTPADPALSFGSASYNSLSLPAEEHGNLGAHTEKSSITNKNLPRTPLIPLLIYICTFIYQRAILSKKLLCGLRLVRIAFKVISPAHIKLDVCVGVDVCTSSAVGHHGKLTAHVDHLLEESRTLPHYKPLIWNRNTHMYNHLNDMF